MNWRDFIWFHDVFREKSVIKVRQVTQLAEKHWAMWTCGYPPETNTAAPENWWLEDETSFWECLFSGARLVLERVIITFLLLGLLGLACFLAFLGLWNILRPTGHLRKITQNKQQYSMILDVWSISLFTKFSYLGCFDGKCCMPLSHWSLYCELK